MMSTITNSLGSAISQFYDSLTISKAVFVIGDKDDPSKKRECKVMINPSSINVATGQKLVPAKGTGSTGGSTQTKTDENGAKQSMVSDQTSKIETRISMELIYDLVSQYDLTKQQNSTAAGLISGMVSFINSEDAGLGESIVGGLNKAVSAYSKIHLFNKDDFDYLAMAEACQKQSPVLFAWGPMQYEGYIERFDSVFSYFSAAGAPLRAKVRLTMLSAQVANAKFKDSTILLKIIEKFTSKSEEDGNATAKDMRDEI